MAEQLYNLRVVPYCDNFRLYWESINPDGSTVELYYRLWEKDNITKTEIKTGITAVDSAGFLDISRSITAIYNNKDCYADFKLVTGAQSSLWSNQITCRHEGPSQMPALSFDPVPSPAPRLCTILKERHGLGRVGNYPFETKLYIVDGTKENKVKISDTGLRSSLQFYYRTVNHKGVYSDWQLIASTTEPSSSTSSTYSCSFIIGKGSKATTEVGTTFEFAVSYDELTTKIPCLTQVQIGGGSNIWVKKHRALGVPYIRDDQGWNSVKSHLYIRDNSNTLNWYPTGGYVADNYFYGKEAITYNNLTNASIKQKIYLPSLGLIPGQAYEIVDSAICCALLTETGENIKDESVIFVHDATHLGKRIFIYNDLYPYLVLFNIEIDLKEKDVLLFNPQIYDTELVKN